MSRRHIIATIALATVLAVLFMKPRPSGTTAGIPVESSHREESAASATPKRIMLPIAADAVRLNNVDGNCRTDLAFLDLVISQYSRHLDGNPVGTNAEISAALRGDNPKGIALLPAKGTFLDSSGRLVDRWGTPYFFHAVARQQMDIVSAGPDREFWTNDDVTTGPPRR